MLNLPIYIAFDHSRTAGALGLSDETGKILNLHEYFLAPAALFNHKTKTWDIIEYGLVHVSQIPTEQQLLEKFSRIEKGSE